MTTSTSTRAKPQPPTEAVAKDAHWAATMDRLNRVKRPVAKLTICPDPEVRERLNKARRDLERTKATLDAVRDSKDSDNEAVAFAQQRADAAQTELDQAQADFDAIAVVLRFEALPRTQLEALMAQHPPTEQDEESGDDVHMDGFAPALISAASLDGMPVDYARQCLDTWSRGEARALWEAAWGVQHQQRTDLGKG